MPQLQSLSRIFKTPGGSCVLGTNQQSCVDFTGSGRSSPRQTVGSTSQPQQSNRASTPPLKSRIQVVHPVTIINISRRLNMASNESNSDFPNICPIEWPKACLKPTEDVFLTVCCGNTTIGWAMHSASSDYDVFAHWK